MNEFHQKVSIAVVSAILGGGVGFGADLILQGQKEEAAREEFARASQYEFLIEMYEERKEAFIRIEAARFRALRDPTPENLDELVHAFSIIPFLQPRLPTNMSILGFRDEISEKLSSLASEAEIKRFLAEDMGKYACIFDVNLQTIEGMIRAVATESDAADLNSGIGEGELARLDNACHSVPLPNDP